MKSLTTIDFVIVGVYMAGMILIGLLLGKANKDDQDYFKGGGKVPWPMSSLSLFIGAFSAYMFVAASGQAYKSGAACLLLFTSATFPFILAAIFFATRWRRTRITSPMEFIEMRFGKGTKKFYILVQMPFSLLSCGSMLYVLAIFISSALGLTGEYEILGMAVDGLQLCIIGIGLIVLIYTTIGGLWAVVVTDTVQFIIVMLVSVTLVVLSYQAISGDGGLGSTMKDLVANAPTPDYYHLVNDAQPLSFSIAWIALILFSAPGGFPLIQRSCCVRDEAAARKTSLLAAVFFLTVPVIWVAPILMMRGNLPDLNELWPQLNNPNEASYIAVALMLLPNGMLGLTISAILAATMSTLSSLYNILASIAARDIYKPLFAPQASSRHLMAVGKVSNLLFSVAAIYFGILLAGHMDAFQTTFTIASHTSLALSLPIVLGLIVRRAPWWTGMVAVAICLYATLSIEFLAPVLATNSDWSLWDVVQEHLFEFKIFSALLICLAVFGLGIVLYDEKRNAAAGSAHLFGLLKKPTAEDDRSEALVPNLRMYRIVGYTLALIGAPLIVIPIAGWAKDPQQINIHVGATFLLLFALILWLTSGKWSPFATVRKQSSLKST